MEIHKGIHIIGLSLYLEESGTVVLSDLHIGYEGEMHKKGVLVPKTQFMHIIRQLEHIFASLEKQQWTCDRVILNGDVKHDFGNISEQEWREILRLIDYLQTKTRDIIVVEGNHDPVLQPIAKKRAIQLVKEYQLDKILVHHGDEAINLQSYTVPPEVIIMGHEHPAIQLEEGARSERYKCFLKGTYEDAVLLCLPSFNPLTMGTDLLREPPISPLLEQDLRDFKAWVVADEVYHFGTLGQLARDKKGIVTFK